MSADVQVLSGHRHHVVVFVTLIGFMAGVGVAVRAWSARHTARTDVHARAIRCDGDESQSRNSVWHEAASVSDGGGLRAGIGRPGLLRPLATPTHHYQPG
jgi:hypothetical protein